MDSLNFSTLGPAGVLLAGAALATWALLRWNRANSLEDQDNRIKEMRALVTVLQADLSNEKKERQESERKCDEKVARIVARLTEAERRLAEERQLTARMRERMGFYENALRRAKVDFPPFDPDGTDPHRPLKDRRRGDDPRYQGPRRRESDSDHEEGTG